MDSRALLPHWNPSLYDESHSFVWKRGEGLIELLSPQPGERVLDLGCGTGHLTARIAKLGATPVGIDSDPGMIEAARRYYPHLTFEVADGAAFEVSTPYDAVFSNAALHWIRPPERAAECIYQALRPGGRLVAEFGGQGNVEQIRCALIAALREAEVSWDPARDPWYFPSIGEYATLLEAHGLGVRYAALFPRPTPLDGGEEGMNNWLRMFGGAYLNAVASGRHPEVIAVAREHLRPHAFHDGTWYADYRRLRIIAERVGSGP